MDDDIFQLQRKLTMFEIVLVEPEIPPNTGNIARLCLAADARLHLVEPLGFSLDDKYLLRAGMDYWQQVKLARHASWNEFAQSLPCDARCFFLTTKTRRAYWDAAFRPGDYLIFGRETKGLPESLLAEHAEHCLTIPMAPQARSLNLATSAGIVLYEALRQCQESG